MVSPETVGMPLAKPVLCCQIIFPASAVKAYVEKLNVVTKTLFFCTASPTSPSRGGGGAGEKAPKNAASWLRRDCALVISKQQSSAPFPPFRAQRWTPTKK